MGYARFFPTTYTEILMLSVGIVGQQGSYCEPNRTSGRLVLFSFLIFFMFLYISYSANIVVLLQSTSTSIQTIKDLTDSHLDFISEDTTYFRYYTYVSIPTFPLLLWSFPNLMKCPTGGIKQKG